MHGMDAAIALTLAAPETVVRSVSDPQVDGIIASVKKHASATSTFASP